MEDNKKIKWHPGFYAGLEYELRKYRNILEYISEYVLSKEPIQMDLLVIKKNEDCDIDESFAKVFRAYNIIEYKSPEDGLNIDDFYKTIGYACLYKGYATKVNQINAENMSISLFRHKKPVKMMKQLTAMGACIESRYPGVYYVSGIINIPTQIVVMSELEESSYQALKILSSDASSLDIEAFIRETAELEDKADKANVDAILQVSVSANFDKYEEIRRKMPMCEALKELMKDELENAAMDGRKEGRLEGNTEGRIAARYEDGMPIEQIAERTHVSVEYVKEVLKKQGMQQ